MRTLLALILLLAGQSFASEAKVLESQEQAIAMFPDIVREGSPLFVAIAARIEAEKVANPALFDDPSWPVQLAFSEATRIGIKPLSSVTSAPTPRDRLVPVNLLSPPPDIVAEQEAQKSADLARLRARRAAQREAAAAAAQPDVIYIESVRPVPVVRPQQPQVADDRSLRDAEARIQMQIEDVRHKANNLELEMQREADRLRAQERYEFNTRAIEEERARR